MAETLTVKLTGQLNTTLLNALALSTASDSFGLTFGTNLVSGTGAGQANQLYCDQKTLAGSGTDTVDVIAFGGATDPLGAALSLARVRILIIQNLNATEANSISVGPAASQGWTAPFSGTTPRVIIPGGSTLVLIAPLATGYVLTGGSSHNLAIVNNTANAVNYNLVVIGANA